MNICVKTLLASAIAFSCTTANAEKLERAELEKSLPILNEIIQKQQPANQVVFVKNIELGEGSSLVYNAKVLASDIDAFVDNNAAQTLLCNQLRAQNSIALLESLDYVQYNYLDMHDKTISQVKVNKEICDNNKNNTGLGANGKYTKEFIQQNIVNPTLAQKDQLNKTLAQTMLMIKDVYVNEGSSYTIEYNALGKLSELYSNADEEKLEKMKAQMVKGTCGQTTVAGQLNFIDSINYAIFAENATTDDKPLLSYTVTQEICKK